MWNITISTLAIVLAAATTIVLAFPQLAVSNYLFAYRYLRIVDIICLTYIAFFLLRNHIRRPDPTTIWIPFGFILFGISQYSFLIWAVDESNFAFTGGLLFRSAGLLVFLAVAYRVFYSQKKDEH
jgi:hypothetical protein